MLGLGDGMVAAAYWLCLASSALCIIYGALKWNSGAEETDEVDRHWAEEEKKIEQEL